MSNMESLKATLEDALRSIAEKKNISPMDIETATKALCALEQIKVMEQHDDSRYTQSHGEHYRRYEGSSTDRGHTPDGGYSGHSIKDRMVAKLESMYDQAKTEHERQVVDEWIKRLEDSK